MDAIPQETRRGREAGEGRKLILVSGSRLKFWSDPDTVRKHLEDTLSFIRPDGLLQGGETTGVDSWAWEWGLSHLESRYNQIMRANWHVHGMGAGRVRNQAMADRVVKARAAGWEVSVHAWWDGRSPGTRHMLDVANRRGLMTVVHDMSRFRQ